MFERKIIFIKPWGTYKVGDEILNPTDVTIRTLCFAHKFGKLIGDPDFEDRVRREAITMQKLQEDISYGLRETRREISEEKRKVSSPADLVSDALSHVVEDIDKKLAPPAPKKTTKPRRSRKKSGSGSSKKAEKSDGG